MHRKKTLTSIIAIIIIIIIIVSIIIIIIIIISSCRTPFTTIHLFGAAEKPSTLQEGRLGLTHKRPSCRPTGTHPFPRSASL